MRFLGPSAILGFACISLVTAQASSTISIVSAPGFAIQRGCARCFLYGCTNDLNSFLQCGGLNYCYCRYDLSSAINSFLSDNLSKYCTPGPATNDISAAISIYYEYCATAVGPPASATEASPSDVQSPSTSIPTPGGGSTPSTGPTLTSTTVQVTTVTASSSARTSLGDTSKWISLPLLLIGQLGILF
jgi:hypothetical protein